jgi:PIN domain nuclease of toxin-antitoxin system
MNLLIDTHILLWWLNDDKKLSNKAEALLSKTENNIVVSAICGWEIAIKNSLGRIEIDIDKIQDAIVASGFSMLPISMQHGLKVASLPKHHNDPFDRLLVAQAMSESMQLVTHDKQIQRYGDFVIFV